MLAERMPKNNIDCWLINAGSTGGKYGTGQRCPLKYTCMVVDVVRSGELAKEAYGTSGMFGLQVPTHIEGVPRELLSLRLAWTDEAAFEGEARNLAAMFQKAFALYHMNRTWREAM